MVQETRIWAERVAGAESLKVYAIDTGVVQCMEPKAMIPYPLPT